jgi:DMSO/TMAO reductase YedYZ molybdopterin-dependent catalytic subunit
MAKLLESGMSFFDRNRKKLETIGVDPARLPPGQYFTERFPVLHVGDVPTWDPSTWELRIFGAVAEERRLSWDELRSLPTTTITTDIHCVTKWSKFDTGWTGVKFTDVLALVKPSPDAAFVIGHAEFGYTANLPLADLLRDDVLLAWEYDGAPLEPKHGAPVRLVVPHLYFWKSVKWLRGIELATRDKPGFWERNGYHNYGDPFREQRYS